MIQTPVALAKVCAKDGSLAVSRDRVWNNSTDSASHAFQSSRTLAR